VRGLRACPAPAPRSSPRCQLSRVPPVPAPTAALPDRISWNRAQDRARKHLFPTRKAVGEAPTSLPMASHRDRSPEPCKSAPRKPAEIISQKDRFLFPTLLLLLLTCDVPLKMSSSPLHPRGGKGLGGVPAPRGPSDRLGFCRDRHHL
jgi:hypothetical protein